MKHKSKFKKLKEIYLPKFWGTRVLMLPILLEDIETLPDDLGHYRRTVQELFEISPVKEGIAYLTIDEKIVEAGQTLRKSGLHVDGWGIEGMHDCVWCAYGRTGMLEWMWDDEQKQWRDGANRHYIDGDREYTKGMFYENIGGIGGMITVSSPAACRAWKKEFEGDIRLNGNCEHLRSLFPLEESELFEAGVAYWCNSTCVHESIPVDMEKDVERTFVRLSMPSDSPWYKGFTPNPKGIKPKFIVTRTFGHGPEEPEVKLNG